MKKELDYKYIRNQFLKEYSLTIWTNKDRNLFLFLSFFGSWLLLIISYCNLSKEKPSSW